MNGRPAGPWLQGQVRRELPFENDAGDRVMLRVAESDQGRGYAALCSEFLRWPRKYEEGLTAPFLPDVDVVPTYCLANACTERF